MMMSQLKRISRRKIEVLILKTVEEVLKEIFGETYWTILQTMEENYNLDFNDLHSKPQAFSHALRDILGKNTFILEDLIIEKLYLTLELTYKLEEGYEFSDYIRDLREQSL